MTGNEKFANELFESERDELTQENWIKIYCNKRRKEKRRYGAGLSRIALFSVLFAFITAIFLLPVIKTRKIDSENVKDYLNLFRLHIVSCSC